MQSVTVNACAENGDAPKRAMAQIGRPGSLLRIALIVCLAILLRVTGLGWGLPDRTHPYPYHPDEHDATYNVTQLLTDPRHLATTNDSRLKGTGYYYVVMAAVMLDESVGRPELGSDDRPAELRFLRRLYYTGRMTSVLFSLGTVIMTFLVGRHLFGPRVGELAALLVAVSPISVLTAHFMKPDCAQAFGTMLTLYLAARSDRNPRWLLAAMFTSGITAALKYPGASSLLLVVAAAVFLQPGKRIERLRITVLGTPLFVAGFLALSPAILVWPGRFWSAIRYQFGYSVATGDIAQPLLRILDYPVLLARGTGVILLIWAAAGVLYALVRPRRTTWLLLAWLIPYGLLIASSSMPLMRYADVVMPALALLMARFVSDAAATGTRNQRIFLWASTALATVTILAVTLLHLSTMLRPDPRDLAHDWLRLHIEPGEHVAITPSYNEDRYFVVPVDPERYRVTRLLLDAGHTNGHLEFPFKFLAVNERAMLSSHPGHREFWSRITEQWELLARFSNHPPLPGLLLKGALPEDLYYLYQEVRIYRRPG